MSVDAGAVTGIGRCHFVHAMTGAKALEVALTTQEQALWNGIPFAALRGCI
jgi:hypothetical protein